MKEPFVHLHVHTQYSWDGACTCREIAEQTKKLGMDSVAITDHGYLHGVIEFYEKCKANGIKPIIGCEFYVDRKRTGSTGKEDSFHLILLAENDAGYQNLVNLASSSATKGPCEAPSIDHDELQKFSKGLIGISSCLIGEIPALTLKRDNTGAINRVLFYKELFGWDHFFLEIRPSNDPAQISANRTIVDISKKFDVPLVAANNVHYLRPEDAELHHILVCNHRNITLNEMYRERFIENCEYLRSSEEMWTLLGKELPQSLLNTVLIAERCQVDLQRDAISVTNFSLSGNETLDTYLCHLALEGLQKRLKTKEPPEEYLKRLHYELSIVKQAGFSDYLCVVADIIDGAHKMSVQTGLGRGYSVGSLLLWSLGITDIDPVRHGLLFELFLDPTGISMPWLGTEVSESGREDILSYIYGKYGTDRVARIIAFERISRDDAVAVTGRAMEMTAEYVNRVIRHLNDKSYPAAMSTIPEYVESNPNLKALCESDSNTAKLLNLAQRIERVAPRCFEDASGIVITPEPVSDTVPVRKFATQRTLTQYQRNHLEKLGIAGIDFYGQKELSVLEVTLSEIDAKGKNTVELDQIPLDDCKTFELILSGNTNGVFPNEIYGIEDLVKRMKPDKFEDLMALIALYRPGPLERGLADIYIHCKHNKKPVDHIHAALIAATDETYGLLLYHEQLVQSIAAITGCSIEEANRIRKTMAKYNPKIIAEYRKKFISDSRKNSISSKDARDLFRIFEMNVRYTSSKAHCAVSAMSIYRSAWLKANNPEEFTEAYLSRSIFDGGLKSTS